MEKNQTDLASTKPSTKRPELLLPVGTKEMALAAIHNGADAIFMGIPGFNARGRSHDFTLEELKEIIDLCHLYDVKVNLAFNVVLFEEELARAQEVLAQILPLGPDAFIVQDLGLAQLIRKMAPEQRIHASTQMTVTNAEAIHLLEDLKISRFVLGRENSLPEIEKIKTSTDKEIEVFVHGALCVSYSGQCFTSESLGGRSANRGQCAQSCRFGYELYADGHKVDLKNKKFLVSPQDLCGLEEIPRLMEMGVDSFKVEGRLKTPDYVATSAQSYHQMIETTMAGKTLSSQVLKRLQHEMATTYSRGFFSGWLHGVNHQKLVTAEFSAHRGSPVGRIIDTFRNTLTMELTPESVELNLSPGDGLFWSKGRTEQGGFIYSVARLPKNRLRIEFARDINLMRDLEGHLVYQNHDKELKKKVARSVEDKALKKRLPLNVEIRMTLGQPLQAIVRQGPWCVEGQTDSPLVLAESRGVSDERVSEEFGALSGSIFKLESIDIQRSSGEEVFIPQKQIKNLRQNLIERLTELKTQGSLNKESVVSNAALPLEKNPLENLSIGAKPRFHILLREKGQVDDLIAAYESGQLVGNDLDYVTLDFEFGRDYAESLQKLRSLAESNLASSSASHSGSDAASAPVMDRAAKQAFSIGVATTRILKPGEYRNLKSLASFEPHHILVRNLGAFYYLQNEYPGAYQLMGDFSLNVTNHLTAQYLLDKGLSSLCLSYDLNHQQVTSVLQQAKASQLEATIYQYMPSFHMEHCVFAAFLSEGSSYKDCGKPCERFHVELKDQFQNWHQIKADQECRNTMYTARAQSAARFLPAWMEAGLGTLRFEALKERGDELITKIKAHIDFIHHRITFEKLRETLGAIESYGLTEGPISREREYESRKKELV